MTNGQKADRPPNYNVGRAAWADALRAMSLGWDLAVPICGGAVLGYFLDRQFQTRYMLTMGLLFLGVIVALYNVGRKLQDEIVRDQHRAENEEKEDAAQ